MNATAEFEVMELKGRQLIDIPVRPKPFNPYQVVRHLAAALDNDEAQEFIDNPYQVVRHLGVALDNDEAQEFIDKEFRVFGDSQGPFLVIRIPAKMKGMPSFIDPTNVDVAFLPQRWSLREGSKSEVICWLVSHIG